MFELTKLITTLVLPPFSIILLGLFALIFFRLNWKKLAFNTALFALLALYIFSLPYTAQKLNDSLVQEDNLTLEDYRQAQAIVLLGGGLRDSKELFSPLTITPFALERMRYAAFLQRETQLPLLITGASPNGNSEAKIMDQELQYFFQIPTTFLEEKARNTRENALFTQKILAPKQIKKIVLITHQWHMQRSKLLFEKAGFEVLPASVGTGKTPSRYELNYGHFLPQSGALFANVQLLKEWLGYAKERFL